MNTNEAYIKKVGISGDRISPRLLFSHLFICKDLYFKEEHYSKRNVFDYEIEYFLFSEGSMWINDKLYQIRSGDIVIRRPGDTTQAFMPFDCYGIFFDLTGSNLKIYDNYFAEQQTFQDYYVNPLINALPTVFHPSDGNKYNSIFDKIQKEFIHREDGSELLIKSLILQLLYFIYNDIKNPLNSQDEIPLQHYNTVKTVIEHINQNLSSQMCLSDLAGLAGFSPNHFQRVFSKVIGISPKEYIIKLRIKKAKEMLTMTSLTITDIAFKCGFENIPYFSFIFSKSVGVSPRSYRAKYTMSV